MKRTLLLSLSLIAASVCAAQSALAADMVLSKRAATPLIEGNVGIPYWTLQAQCAGTFGATYNFHKVQNRLKDADEDKSLGVAMLDDAIARLQTDRGLDRDAAMQLAIPQVEYGRGLAQKTLDSQGAVAESRWNILRSICLDVEQAYRNQASD